MVGRKNPAEQSFLDRDTNCKIGCGDCDKRWRGSARLVCCGFLGAQIPGLDEQWFDRSNVPVPLALEGFPTRVAVTGVARFNFASLFEHLNKRSEGAIANTVRLLCWWLVTGSGSDGWRQSLVVKTCREEFDHAVVFGKLGQQVMVSPNGAQIVLTR